MKVTLPDLMTKPEKEERDAKNFIAAIKSVKKAIADSQAKDGEVKAGKAPVGK